MRLLQERHEQGRCPLSQDRDLDPVKRDIATDGPVRVASGVMLVLAALWLALAVVEAVEAKEQSAAIRGHVEPGKTYSVRLRNLPAGATLAISLTASDNLVVWLLSERSYSTFPTATQPLFRGDTSGTLEFSLRIPATGHYFIVLDNRAHDRDRDFSLSIKAAAE